MNNEYVMIRCRYPHTKNATSFIAGQVLLVSWIEWQAIDHFNWEEVYPHTATDSVIFRGRGLM